MSRKLIMSRKLESRRPLSRKSSVLTIIPIRYTLNAISNSKTVSLPPWGCPKSLYAKSADRRTKTRAATKWGIRPNARGIDHDNTEVRYERIYHAILNKVEKRISEDGITTGRGIRGRRIDRGMLETR